jgi:phosphatidylinositol N-acetylglucosaminyltransferase subunit A
MPFSILLVSDFFYPQYGGVETHLYQLAAFLLRRGHRVCLLTHAYGPRSGVRYLPGGLKVYHLPRLPMYNSTTFPNVFGAFHALRDICAREGVQVVHAHQAFSTLAYEAVLWARTLGLRAVFTDHSIIGFHDASNILMNKILKFSLADAHAVICVSHTSKENTVLRACVPPARIHVVPNAVDAAEFPPDPARRAPGRLTVVFLGRLVHRKGIDLLAEVIAETCRRHADVDFVVGGDGPKRRLVEDMVAQEGLAARVTLLGAVPPERVRDVLVRGHVFLNTSLTEAFCMAVVEAACAGLLVVATRVGGVPEVLPREMMVLAWPSVRALVQGLDEALARVRRGDVLGAREQHERVRAMYTWDRVAARTEAVYAATLTAQVGEGGGDGNSVFIIHSSFHLDQTLIFVSRALAPILHHTPPPSLLQRDDSLLGRVKRYYLCGAYAGKIFSGLMIVAALYRWLVDFFCPICSEVGEGEEAAEATEGTSGKSNRGEPP